MLIPLRIDRGVPVYSSSDIEVWGLPDHYGIWDYLVVETRETAHPMVNGWVDLARCSLVPRHEYSRIQRFAGIVRNLLGQGRLPDEVIEYVEDNLEDFCAASVWESVQVLLRRMKWGRYGNRIPVLLERFGFKTLLVQPKKSGVMVDDVMIKFEEMSRKFDRMPKTTDWQYFPSMRYCALRLMQMNGIVFNYRVPLVKTRSKVNVINQKFNILFEDYKRFDEHRSG